MSTHKWDTEAVAARIREVLVALRERDGISQNAAAKAIGVSTSFMGAAASGKSKPSMELVLGMWQVYGVSLEWLLAGVGTPAGSSAGTPEFADPDLTVAVERLRRLHAANDNRFAQISALMATLLGVEGEAGAPASRRTA